MLFLSLKIQLDNPIKGDKFTRRGTTGQIKQERVRIKPIPIGESAPFRPFGALRRISEIFWAAALNLENACELRSGTGRRSLSPRLRRPSWKGRLRAAFPLWEPRQLETKAGYELPVLVLDDIGTFDALESRLGVFVPERSGFLVIGFSGG